MRFATVGGSLRHFGPAEHAHKEPGETAARAVFYEASSLNWLLILNKANPFARAHVYKSKLLAHRRQFTVRNDSQSLDGNISSFCIRAEASRLKAKIVVHHEHRRTPLYENSRTYLAESGSSYPLYREMSVLFEWRDKNLSRGLWTLLCYVVAILFSLV